MLEDMLVKDNISIVYEKLTWEEAIITAITPLVLSGCVEERYGRAIIESTKKYGAYYILTKDIALLHSKPEEGVKRRQMGITLVKEGVIFPGKSEPIKLLIVLAAVDNEGHIDAMKDIADLIIDKRRIGEILNAESVEKIYEGLSL
ncbi:PTS sugar transporter subunit IIA [Alloiococcus sp. CFN-8]|uniref:PTS sugar transporter subunit IIA n=1 Tax=Alloiococcus sp. CFN-8 TaxID=3416081 RepID=UPI003CE7CD96